MEVKSFITVAEAKKHLYNNRTKYVSELLETANSMCMNAGKLSVAEWNSIVDYTPDNTEILMIRDKEYKKEEILNFKRVLRSISYIALCCLSAHDQDGCIEICEIEQTIKYLIPFK